MTHEEAIQARDLILSQRAQALKDGLYILEYEMRATGRVRVSHKASEWEMYDEISEDIRCNDEDDLEFSIRCAACHQRVDVGHNCIEGDFDPDEYPEYEEEVQEVGVLMLFEEAELNV